MQITPRNPLEFPYWRVPGFNPNHIVNRQWITGGTKSYANGATTSISLIAPGSAKLICPQRPSRFPDTVTGAQTAAVKTYIGNTVFFTTGTNSYVYTVTSVGDPTGAIIGAVMIPGASAANAWIAGCGSGTTNTSNLSLNSLVVTYFTNGTNNSSTIAALTAGDPYFIAGSFDATNFRFVVTHLKTGKITNTSIAGTSNMGFAGTASVNVGGSTSNGCGYLAAVMIIQNPGYSLGNAELIAWASDPWSYWYPPTPEEQFAEVTGIPIRYPDWQRQYDGGVEMIGY